MESFLFPNISFIELNNLHNCVFFFRFNVSEHHLHGYEQDDLILKCSVKIKDGHKVKKIDKKNVDLGMVKLSL